MYTQHCWKITPIRPEMISRRRYAVYKKAGKVDVFQFGADAEVSAPSWFMKELEKEQIFINRVITDGATKVYGCTITTAYGKQRAKNGDYIVRAANGSIFPVKKNIFRTQYERVKT